MNEQVKDTRLGKQATDKVTGFTGIVSGTSQYLHGTGMVCISSKANDLSKNPEDRWLPEERVEVKE